MKLVEIIQGLEVLRQLHVGMQVSLINTNTNTDTDTNTNTNTNTNTDTNTNTSTETVARRDAG